MHFVDGGMDTGPVIAQRALAVEDDDTADTLAERIHRIEYELYPEVVAALQPEKSNWTEEKQRFGNSGRAVQSSASFDI